MIFLLESLLKVILFLASRRTAHISSVSQGVLYDETFRFYEREKFSRSGLSMNDFRGSIQEMEMHDIIRVGGRGCTDDFRSQIVKFNVTKEEIQSCLSKDPFVARWITSN